jgi:hypothetical protein
VWQAVQFPQALAVVGDPAEASAGEAGRQNLLFLVSVEADASLPFGRRVLHNPASFVCPGFGNRQHQIDHWVLDVAVRTYVW